MRGKEGYGALGSEVRANWGSLVLQRARHGGVGVAAARSFGGGVAKGGGTSARGQWFQELVKAPREVEAKLNLAGGDPARRRAAWRCRRRGKQGSREKGERGPVCKIRKFQGPECKTRITFKLKLK